MSCERHEMGEWMPVRVITDMRVRYCRHCRAFEMTIEPPVRSKPRPERGWWNWYTEEEDE